MVVLLKIVQVILALSILVLVHEFGHFIFAKLFKIKVEKFYLFFDAGFALFKFKPKNSDTEYGIGWLPLGGYCKIAGMIDESMDKEAMKEEPKPWEFRSKPAWQRFFVMFGGVFFNLILAILLYSATLFTWGEEYLKNEEAKYGVYVNDLAYEMGFRNGDKIISFDGVATDNFNNLQIDMVRSQAKEAKVLRGNDTITIALDESYIPKALNTPGMFGLAFPFIVGEVPDSSLNASSGLIPGDEIVAINGEEMFITQEIKKTLQNLKSQTITATVLRSGDSLQIPLAVDSVGRIEVMLDGDMTKIFDITTKSYSLLGSVGAGAKKAWITTKNYVEELGLIFSPKTEAYKSVGSFIRIGSIFPSTWDWQNFWSITAWLSIMLAVLNILPIPALDGGHILFLFYEIITRRKPSDKFMEIAQMVGMFILFGIMILAFGNDIISLFR